MADRLGKGIKFLQENSLFLLIGTALALAWANLDHASYEHVLHYPLLENRFFGYLHHGHRVINLHYLVNDLFFAFFFAKAAKEVWEQLLPGGNLHNPKEAATSLFGMGGGMIGPVVVYLGGAYLIGEFNDLSHGWAVSCATDIAFSYMVARFAFGPKHVAIPFLLLMAIGDDGATLAILTTVYPQGEIQLIWLVLPALAIVLGLTFNKVLKLRSFWWYILIPGAISWIGFALAGLHPALGLVPVIPTMPHAKSDLGIYHSQETKRKDTLSEFATWWENPIELILFAFGLCNAGVVFSSIGKPSLLVMVSLIVGKAIGIWLGAMFAVKVFKFSLPEGMNSKHLFVVGCAAGIGFTVALFVATVAFPAGELQDSVKMGALLSFSAAIVTLIFGRIFKVKEAVNSS